MSNIDYTTINIGSYTLTLDHIKRHLNIDNEFIDDDGYIMSLASVSKEIVEKHIDYSFDEFDVVPKPLIQVILLLIGNFYANREEVIYASTSKLPHSVDYILGMFKNYKCSE